MVDIAALEPNGRKVISTFSGCGGSSLGYRMAGCEIVAANEFVPAAQEVYRMNASPSTVLLPDDIRTMTGHDFLQAVGLSVGELDIFDGSPPCASFSSAGKRSGGWGQVKKYSDTAQRVDDLFYEYARVLKEIQPKAFIAENVDGLVRGESKGYFKMIYRELEQCGYQVAAAVLDASRLGVPQARKRLIFIGLRNDLRAQLRYPTPLPYRYSLGDALRLTEARIARRNYGGTPISINRPCPTITTQSDEYWMLDESVNDPETETNLRREWGDEQYENLLRVMFDIETDRHIGFTKYAIGAQWKPLRQGESSEKYFQLVRPSVNKPCPTITATGGNPGAASVTHPIEPRKFNLQELRRICSFPDDFILAGSYEQRWERLGRSVPPVMMKAIATTMCEILDEAEQNG